MASFSSQLWAHHILDAMHFVACRAYVRLVHNQKTRLNKDMDDFVQLRAVTPLQLR
ncbi:MAG: hypothetical protein ACJAZW_000382 [Maritalea sp.]|jgi:hypothetical protein